MKLKEREKANSTNSPNFLRKITPTGPSCEINRDKSGEVLNFDTETQRQRECVQGGGGVCVCVCVCVCLCVCVCV